MTDSIYDFNLSPDSLDCFFENEVAFCQLPRERISDLLLSQLVICQKLRIHNIFYITDEMKYLEGINYRTRTAKEKPFRGDLLKGLWKKHFYSDRFLPRNLANFLSSKEGRKAFSSFFQDVMQENQGDFIEDETLRRIADFASYGVYKLKTSRAGKEEGALTGEWLIYGKHNGLNYYLCIARHNAGDDKIRGEIERFSLKEFPFLFKEKT